METFSKMMLETPDLNAERLAKLKKLFPDLFTVEGKLNEDELKKIIEADGGRETERYDFRWFGKSQAKRNAFTPTNTTLIYDEARSVNPTANENIIIEGENLEVLKLLQCAYREQVKCIYIDPPYNTGKDFVYSDNYTEEKRPYWEKTGAVIDGVKQTTNPDTSGRYHSDWLNMMFSRLLVAHSLLKPDGVIFISIDDNEVTNLRKLCDEVFGDSNFIGNIVWKRRASSALAEKNFSTDHEYVICYQKSDSFEYFLGKEKDFSSYSNPDNDSRGDWTLGDLTVGMGRDLRPNQYYDLVDPKTGSIYKPNPNRVWAYIPESMEKLVNENRVYFPSDTSKRPMIKRFKNELKSENNPVSTFVENVGNNSEGTRDIQSFFGGSIFTYSKPKSLIKFLVSNIEKSKGKTEDIFLDFFSGSGVLGQAVFELNQEDGGNRKFILAQIPELTDEKSEAYKAGYKKISDITIERNKRVVKKIIAEKEAAHPNLYNENKDALKGLGFKVFQLIKSNFPRTEFKPDAEKSDEENLTALKEYVNEKERQQTFKFNLAELLTEILLKQGFMLNFTYEQKKEHTHNNIYYATDGEKETLICLDEEIKLETIEQLKEAKQKFICLERALDTTKKWNLNHYLGEKFQAF